MVNISVKRIAMWITRTFTVHCTTASYFWITSFTSRTFASYFAILITTLSTSTTWIWIGITNIFIKKEKFNMNSLFDYLLFTTYLLYISFHFQKILVDICMQAYYSVLYKQHYHHIV